jgi:hypothetical protein
MLGCGATNVAHAWGDEGHEIVALVADHYLDASVRQKVNTILAGDSTHLTPSTQMSDEATWADKYRDSDRNTTHIRYDLTHLWHYVDVEIDGSNDVDQACSGHPTQPPQASSGPATDCVVDKINAFIAELKSPSTSADEKRMALQFLLHFVGDVHQPLHASDDHDQGGNDKKVKAMGVATGKLHHYWDTEFVTMLGSNPTMVAQQLVSSTTSGQVKTWSKGDAASWAKQSFDAAKLYGYAGLGSLDSSGKYNLSTTYVTTATKTVARQLARAGVRLAKILNDALQ